MPMKQQRRSADGNEMTKDLTLEVSDMLIAPTVINGSDPYTGRVNIRFELR